MDKKSAQIHVIGINASSIERFSAEKEKLILEAERIAAPERFLDSFKIWLKEKKITKFCPEFYSTGKLQNLISWIKEEDKKTIIFSSGDPLWFGIGRLLIQNFPLSKLSFEPAPTSFQLAFSRLGKPWHDTKWISIHGRDPLPFKKAIQKRPSSLVVLNDPNRGGAKEVWELLHSIGLETNYELWTFERLGYQNERILKISSIKNLPIDLDPLHMVILFEKSNSFTKPEDLPLFGIDDSVFLQNSDCPGLMTKREIRIQLLADLNLPKEGVIWDICSGVGSIGLEALRISPKLKLLTIEKRVGSRRIIETNAERLGVKPFKIIEGEALVSLKENRLISNINSPDRVILGGGGPRSYLILEEIFRNIKSGSIIVIPLISLKSLSKLEEILKPKVNCISISQHQSYRGIPIGEDTRFSPLNPVFILKAEFK